MMMPDNEELSALRKMVSGFAAEHIAPRSDLRNLTVIPPDLIEAMAAKGLFGIGIPAAYEGLGGGWLHIGAAGKALAESGCNLGTCLSWLMQAIIARFLFLGFGTDGQKAAFLPDMARGARISCLAISEPGVGGHPKRLKTVALNQGDTYRITGEKAYLTNGPIAGLFVVLAVTGEEGGKKSYTAFIVPGDAPGLKKTAPMDLGFLRPCPHGGIILDNLDVGRDCILGRTGGAYTDMALPFRQLEDVMMAGIFVGGAQAQIRMLASSLREHMTGPDKEITSALGEIIATVSSVEVLSRTAAGMLDEHGPSYPELLPVVLFLRRTAAAVQSDLNALVAKAGLEMGHTYDSLTNDMVSSMRVAENVSRIKQEKLGRSLIS